MDTPQHAVLQIRRWKETMKICPKLDSTICFSMFGPYTAGVAEVAEMLSKEDLLRCEYLLNQKWAVTRMIQSYESDEKLAYIHGFDAGIDLLCAKAKLSHPAIADNVKELAGKMAEETAATLRSLTEKRRLISSWRTF